ncbi:hypothetical protein A2634_02230 [Candidatus Amesbacteria bacterium RIFCSPHIGHO2_01_FULL_48_32]|uniref:Glycosyltransferase 2-like domain-containing protein n=1 Tax=Candidatus Amesbacteria bacterium RIFCSPLOWO2_01_FULL_48_25 TaxID=1797259 RepID=A0A1F4ZDM9_9BACT|nr:MAG: hypothetical protein A2634_02230 [Candidatus Amesbacteria bacterium RIFCSPHIGHO2_01_FULL_48_32]OGD04403.1 MAG: hypothetical protein A2989_05235 [Candidatus Amesbacteria bacterium RIFCSPLOWO2_01_FULL_48_25]HJZ06243.1 glycosyltransferase [Patescibacteria group bacterium]
MSGDRPFFSVIIPTLNEERYLPKLLKCLEGQLDRSFEVVVVDGKSEDKTVEKAQGLEVIISEKRNVSWQRNLGAKRARGKYLVFLDADVEVPANYLSEIHHYLLVNKDCRVMTTWMRPDSNNDSDKAMVLLMNLIVEVAKMAEKPVVGGYNIVIRKSVFENVGGFNPKIKIGEDYDLISRLAKVGETMQILRRVRATLSLRRYRHEGTLTYLRQAAVGTLSFWLKGPITRELFDYPMGGEIYRSRRKSGKGKLVASVKKYLTRLNGWLQI